MKRHYVQGKHKNARNDLQFWLFSGNNTLNPLNDLTVLELASVLAGPGVGQFFAELGARVIKVENIKTGGDVTRSWRSRDENTDDRSAYFCSVNWGKQSIAVDLSTEEGREIVQRLSKKSDIVIASFKPGDAARLGVDYASLSFDHPGLIYGQITGYGSANPRVGYDAIIQAEAGFMYLNAEPGGQSLKMPVALMDILAGHHLKEALLLAMLEKERTGRGKLVEVSLIDAAVASLANQATNYLVAGVTPEKQGSAHPNIAPYGEVYETADEQEILLAVGTDKQFDQLCNILNISDLSNDIRFRDNPSRVRHRAELTQVLRQAIACYDAKDLMARLSEKQVPAGLVRKLPDVFSDPATIDMMLSGHGFRGVRTFALRDDELVSSHLLPPPHFGEHTESLLLDMLKFSPSDVISLRSKGVVQ
ncbi:MAG TPA: CaiB/BaiF CoA-transferase family protein [Chryseosolibacter sp.]|nr:CaiB/BaiF CoA-transferase family protein [Chryseosolibacter sp.]